MRYISGHICMYINSYTNTYVRIIYIKVYNRMPGEYFMKRRNEKEKMTPVSKTVSNIYKYICLFVYDQKYIIDIYVNNFFIGLSTFELYRWLLNHIFNNNLYICDRQWVEVKTVRESGPDATQKFRIKVIRLQEGLTLFNTCAHKYIYIYTCVFVCMFIYKRRSIEKDFYR